MADEIDTDLYSRQIFALGLETVQSLARLDVCIFGMSAVGVEVAKNLCLAGPRSVTVVDPTAASWNDLSGQFYLSEDDVRQKRPRGAASAKHLAELNAYVQVRAMDDARFDDADFLKQFSVVVACDVGRSVADVLDELVTTHFIWTECRGPFASLFVNFGDNFTVRDTDGRNKQEFVVLNVSNSSPCRVRVMADPPLLRHLEDGSEVEFLEVQGASELNKVVATIKLVSRDECELVGIDSSTWGRYRTGGIMRETKRVSTVSHRPLCACWNEPGEFQLEDWSKFGRAEKLFHLFRGDVDEELTPLLESVGRGVVSPLCALVGGIAAQEVLKTTGKFTPLTQWAFLDCLELIPSPIPSLADRAPRNDRCDGLRAVLGQRAVEEIGAMKLLMVGAGALGCELLKGLACIGATGELTVTDMDHIEKSNLNRQFLFRPNDIGQPKSTVACAAVQRMNPNFKKSAMRVLEQPVGPTTEHIFTRELWSKQSAVLTALDNWEARLYCDQRCVEHLVPMIEGGTLGSTGHTQVVIPHLTAHFGATALPREEQVPSCTIHLFPHTIPHVIAWAREQFEAFFVDAPRDILAQRNDSEHLPAILSRLPPAGKIQLLQQWVRAVDMHPATTASCVASALALLHRWYIVDMQALLSEYPPNALDDDGLPFWASPKRPPTVLDWNPMGDSFQFEFVNSAARLFARRHGLPPPNNVLFIIGELEKSSKTYLEPELEKSEETILEQLNLKRTGGNDNNVEPLPVLVATEFEKDDDQNDHVAFLHSAGMLRAQSYGITAVGRLEAKRVAGAIVPAMVTTTAAITGLMLLQLLRLPLSKISKSKITLESFAEAQLDLATNLLALAEPQEPSRIASVPGKIRAIPEKHCVWDRVEISVGDASIRALAVHLGSVYNAKLNSVACEGLALYRGSDKETRETRAKMKITDIYCQLRGLDAMPAHKYRLVLALVCTDKTTHEDIEFAQVSFQFREGAPSRKKKAKKEIK